MILVSCVSCEKDINTYEGDSGIYFADEGIFSDTLRVAWGLKNSDIKMQSIQLKVCLYGNTANYDRKFNIEVYSDTDTLSAIEGVDFKAFATEYVMSANQAETSSKGGNIKRITQALDPRGYKVIPIASPKPYELARHYLWRFWERLPKEGHIVIFDRTWYGRVMVERLEGFCTESDWKRAYTEINEFEQQLTDWGAVILKFWVQIDKDTQLKRFEDRQNDPDKQWKITEEDWRNREKWDSYEQAIDEMLQKTSTQYAPWHIIESNCKYYARIKALELLTDALEAAIDKAQKQNKK